MRNRTVGRPPSRTLTASGRSHPSSARPSSAPVTGPGAMQSIRQGVHGMPKVAPHFGWGASMRRGSPFLTM
jgi:hypothetical protein